MPTVDQHLDEFTVACQQLIETIGDLRVRGFIKEHPEYIEHSAGLVAVMLVEIRGGLARERAAAEFPPLPDGLAASVHAERTADFGQHRCNCGWCRNAV
jgi:hypothetical protein